MNSKGRELKESGFLLLLIHDTIFPFFFVISDRNTVFTGLLFSFTRQNTRQAFMHATNHIASN